MLRKIIAFLLPFLLLPGFFSGRTGGDKVPTLAELTDREMIQERLDNNEPFTAAEFWEMTEGGGSGFITEDAQEIEELWSAFNQIEVVGESDTFITDWYPMIVFYFEDGSGYPVIFDGHYLEARGKNWNLKNDEAFWSLVYELVEKHAQEPEPEPIDGPEQEYWPNSVDLYFPTNPTTGYGWEYEISDPSLVEVTDAIINTDTSQGGAGLVGRPQEHWFHIRGTAEGVTSVTFRYRRSWETEEPLYEFTYRMTINEKLDVMIWGVEMK